MQYTPISDSFNMVTGFNDDFTLTNASTSAHIKGVISRLRDLGIDIDPSSRLYRYAAIFDPVSKFYTDNSLDMKGDFALVESLQFSAIASCLESMADCTPWLSKTRSATEGAFFATDDRLDTRARSDQFELFLMASLVKAGFVLEAAEPDLIAKVGQQRLAIAAKRLRSGSKLERNLKDGAKQIKRQRLPGIVAIDISFIELINKPLYINKSEHQMVPAKVLLDGFAQENMSLILKICERYKCSVLLHLCCSTRSVKSSTLFVSRRWLLISNQFDPVCNHLITGFQQLKP